MNITIYPSTAKGTIKAQPSKSMAHREIIAAMLSSGTSEISNVAFSEDILATMDCAKALGAGIDQMPDSLRIAGIASSRPDQPVDFMCRESGSTMRFFMGIAMALGSHARFFGSDTLLNRPFQVYEEICKKQGITFLRHADHIEIDGQLQPDTFEIPGNISSQFISGLLFGLPLLAGDSSIHLIPPVESRSYIELTLRALRDFGILVRTDGDVLSVPGQQAYRSANLSVEGDFSNAAFPEALNLFGGKVTVTGLPQDSAQGDAVYTKHFESLQKGAATVDLSDCPDLGPVLFAVAACLHGGDFTGTKRLRMKESDRGRVMCEELAKCGVETIMEENFIRILPSALHAPKAELSGHNDHRIVMALSVLLTRIGGTITGAEAVRKSYPGFFDDLRELGIQYKIMD
ncbi:MAG: 3-phosphoshikimate 1-carboxyvinyltransferase [Lachnospiraceae bacterium]|nr:3-phosphoshikimate 1-carboxyvinyltransferase [Lachnospiraceae bacterium]